MGDVDRNAEAFPTATMTPPIPTGLIPTPRVSLGSALSVIFSRPSAWLAAGTCVLLILETLLLALHDIPAAQLSIFKDIQSGTLLLFGIMVRDVFHGDNK